MFPYILIGIAVLVVLLLIIVATRPANFRIVRQTSIAAPAPVVFDQVNDFHKWDAWSPWAKLDPNATNTFEGASAGVGAIFKWSGNKKVGEGKMTVTESRPSDLIRLKLEFLRPFKCTNAAEFTFTLQAGQTLVTWAMTGENHFCAKLFGLIVSIDKMVGKDFEKGLASMKAVAESGSLARG